MMADRSDNDSLEVTHELLADMLGVRSTSITMAAGDLQDEGAIEPGARLRAHHQPDAAGAARLRVLRHHSGCVPDAGFG